MTYLDECPALRLHDSTKTLIIIQMNKTEFGTAFRNFTSLQKPASKEISLAIQFREIADRLFDQISELCSLGSIQVIEVRNGEIFRGIKAPISKRALKLSFLDLSMTIAPEIDMGRPPIMYLHVRTFKHERIRDFRGWRFVFNHTDNKFYNLNIKVMTEQDWLSLIAKCLLPTSSDVFNE
jgi:hypothetical protein